MTENIEGRARAQCRADLIANRVRGAKLARAVDRYWIVVAAESSGGVGLFSEAEHPADFADRKREFLHLIGKRDRYG